MRSLMYPSIDLESTFEMLDADTWRRGMAYAREGRVLRCLWDPDAEQLSGTVRGNKGQALLTFMWIGGRVVWAGTGQRGRTDGDLSSMALTPIDPGAVRARINPTQFPAGAARCAGR